MEPFVFISPRIKERYLIEALKILEDSYCLSVISIMQKGLKSIQEEISGLEKSPETAVCRLVLIVQAFQPGFHFANSKAVLLNMN